MSTQDWINIVAIPTGFIVWISCITTMHRAVIVKKRTDFNIDGRLLNTSTMIGAMAFWYFLANLILERLFAWNSWPLLPGLIAYIIVSLVTFIGFGLFPLSYYSVEQDKLRNRNE